MTDVRSHVTSRLIHAVPGHLIHATEFHVNEGRRHGASSARRSRERRWRACSAAMAGAVLLAVGSGGCATTVGEHQVASRTSLGSGSAEGGTGSGGKLTSAAAKGSGKSKAQSGAGGSLAGVTNGVMFGGDLPLASIAGQTGPQAGDRARLRSAGRAVPEQPGGQLDGERHHRSGEHRHGPRASQLRLHRGRPARPVPQGLSDVRRAGRGQVQPPGHLRGLRT